MSPDHAAWFAKGDEDLAMIEIAVAARGPWPQIAYHAQQLAEKYLKGFLVHHGILPPRVHDLQRLLDLCAVHDPTLETLRDDCIGLTEAGARARYPGWTDEPGATEGQNAVAAAKRVQESIRVRVPQ